MKKIVTALVLGTFLIGCGGSDGETIESGSQKNSPIFNSGDSKAQNPSQKEGTQTVNKSIKEILKTKELNQNQYYKTTYNCQGNMLKCIKTFKINDSIGKVCSFHTLDSTSVTNPYTNEPYSIGRGMADDGRTTYTIMWQYGATEGSHIDFYVTCKTQEQIKKEQKSLAEIYDLNIPKHSDEKDVVNLTAVRFLDQTHLNYTSDIHTASFKKAIWDFNDSKWAGLSAKANGRIVLKIDSTSDIDFADINEVLFSHDTISHNITVDIIDKDSNIIKTNTINDTNDKTVVMSLFIGDIKNSDPSTLLYNIRSHMLTE